MAQSLLLRHRQAGLGTVWEGGWRAGAAASLSPGMWERRGGEQTPKQFRPPRDTTSGALARAPSPKAALRCSTALGSAEQVSMSALAERRAETSLTAQALRTLRSAQTGGQTGAEEPFRSPWL